MEQTNRELQSQISDLRSRLTKAERAARDLQADSKTSSDSRSGTQNERIRELEHQLEIALEETTKRVGETSQFRGMRDMVQKKNNTIRDLMRRLDKYEPDNSKFDEEDD